MKRENGRIVEVHRNYGYLQSLDNPESTYPFELQKNMIVEKSNQKYFSFSDIVSYKTSRQQGLRGRASILVADDLQPISDTKFEAKLPIIQDYLTNVRRSFSKFKISIPSNIEDDASLYEWLKQNGFQPRMLDYLQEGIFYSDLLGKATNIDVKGKFFSIKDIVQLDQVDQDFRGHLMKWIVGVEDACKSLISRLSSTKDGKEVANLVIKNWENKNAKGAKQVRRAKFSKMFRYASDNFDYITGNSVPIEDLMLQLDLSELPEFLKMWRETATTTKIVILSPVLELLVDNTIMLRDLGELRNAAAHGRPLIPSWVDPDYNPNWDLEFANVEQNSSLDHWTLLVPLQNIWKARGTSDEQSKQIIQTVFGNLYRRAWMELNYIYVTFVPMINQLQTTQYLREANWFLAYSERSKGWSTLINKRLVDMGDLTHFDVTGMPPVYRTITNEAVDIWNL